MAAAAAQEGGKIATVEVLAAAGIATATVDKTAYIPLFDYVLELGPIMFTLDDIAKVAGFILICFLIRDRYRTAKEGKTDDSNHTTRHSDDPKDKIR